MSVSSIVKRQMFKRPPLCTPDLTVFEAAVEIAALQVTALAVVDRGKLLGIITDCDIIQCLADSGADFYEQMVNDWMTENVVTCNGGTRLSTALNLMAKHGIQHLAFIEKTRAVSVINIRELLTRVHENDELQLRVLRETGDT